jgi:hypothetical protein
LVVEISHWFPAVSCHVQLERTGPYQTSGDYEVLKMVQRQPFEYSSLCRRFQLECADCPTVTERSKRGGLIPIYLTQVSMNIAILLYAPKCVPNDGKSRQSQ